MKCFGRYPKYDKNIQLLRKQFCLKSTFLNLTYPFYDTYYPPWPPRIAMLDTPPPTLTPPWIYNALSTLIPGNFEGIWRFNPLHGFASLDGVRRRGASGNGHRDNHWRHRHGRDGCEKRRYKSGNRAHRNETEQSETKRSELKWAQTKRNETNFNETKEACILAKRNKAKRKIAKWNGTKRRGTWQFCCALIYLMYVHDWVWWRVL